ncbi:ferredoxin reductase [Nocardia jejuensis]|uniref:ferredoxin reductase n=1 Tax=Nocardia jejuensis TaxID=328049 RepID=UPI000829AA94|nr:ferredoxin reductase [Nocardia jejuensis]
MRWQPAELVAARFETPSARTLTLRVPAWPGHLPGQHMDVRLTAPDGYHAERSYSLAAPADGDLIELTVQRVPDGEVSGYLVDGLPIGASIEVRGPVGGWFVWRPDRGGPAVLIAGGSGIVPLVAMLRARRKSAAPNPFRVIYSLRDPEDLYYREELTASPGSASSAIGTESARLIGSAAPADRAAVDSAILVGESSRGTTPGSGGPVHLAESGPDGIDVFLAYTRSAPPGFERPAQRLTAEEIAQWSLPPGSEVTCYVCGPTPFVEFAAAALVSAGHDPAMIRTERFGPTGK